MKNSKGPRLGAGGKRLWASVLSGWDCPEEQHQLLENVCKSQDRIDLLSKMIEAEGPVQRNRFGVAIAHPAALLLRSEVANFSQLYRLLQLAAPSGDDGGPGRPAGWVPED
jgi:hypothetical protein